ncbi:MAG: hypothetical protein IBJ18_09905 [Phycisphaerales bacterium]|nr:hypothetical protein [Phycisphaerales bacterium]
MSAPVPGDFLSPSPNLEGSSLALIPPGYGSLPTGWQGQSRPTLEGAVDLITGVPLAEFTDTTLPFGGAEFRLRRTRSADSPGNSYRSQGGPGATDASDRWWDWVGCGWMSSENPVLLIDSALADVTGDGPRTTYLWLDAHHNIPFQQVFHPNAAETNGGRIEYEAPPRFRARLKHNGIAYFPQIQIGTGQTSQLDPNNQIGWLIPPSQFEIWLYDGAVKYTFVAMYDRVARNDGSGRYDALGPLPPSKWNRTWFNQAQTSNSEPPAEYVWSSYNARPFTRNQFVEVLKDSTEPQSDFRWSHSPWDVARNPGLGLPHVGICVRIETPQNHLAEITHQKVQRQNFSINGSVVAMLEDHLARGAIKSIKLKVGGDTKWTLLYTYKRFRGLD